MSYLSVERMTSSGDLRIVHGACQIHVCAILDLITTELRSKRVRILHVVAPAHGKLGLTELISQLAGNPPSQAVAANVPTDGDVERAHHLLTTLDKGCDHILLLIEGAQSLQPTALRYIQHVSRTTPHLRLALVGADEPAMLRDAEFTALSRRAATELRLDEHAVSAEASLRSALSSVRPPGAATPETISVDAGGLPPTPPQWMTTDLSQAATERQPRAGGRNWAAMAMLSLVALTGTGAWWHHLAATQALSGTDVGVMRVSETLPNDGAVRVETMPVSEAAGALVDRPRPALDDDPPVAVVAASVAESIPAPPEIGKPAPAPPPTPAEAVTAPSPPQPLPAAAPKEAGDDEALKAEPRSADSAPDQVLDPLPASASGSPPGPAPTTHDQAGIEPPLSPPPAVAAPDVAPTAIPEVTAPRSEGPARQDDASSLAKAMEKSVSPDVPQAATLPAATEIVAASVPIKQAPAIADGEVTRADRLLDAGDISGARRWYEHAAGKGSAIAATSLGKTYDPNVLIKWHLVGGVAADPEKARLWYEKGAVMGDRDAASLLAALNAGH